MRLRLLTLALIVILGLGFTANATRARAQSGGQSLVAWAPKPEVLPPYKAPNRPLWRLSEILAEHGGQSNWSQTVVATPNFVGTYISMAPGKKTKTVFYSDDRVFWVIEQGEVRFTIEGQPSFVASKGFLVQVPYRIPFSLETIGNIPSLRFELRPSEPPIYPISETPAPVPGVRYIRARYSGHGHYDDLNRPFLDFEKEIVRAGRQAPSDFLKDPYLAIELFRGSPQKVPPASELGHFRANYPGLWFVLEGKEDFLIEGEPLFVAEEGDVVFAPVGRWHRVTASGNAMSTRLAIDARPQNLHWYPSDSPSSK